MGLNISVEVRRKIVCDNCGEIAGYGAVQAYSCSGRSLMPIVRDIGYTDEDYGEYIELSPEKQKRLVEILSNVDPGDGYNVSKMMRAVAVAYTLGDAVFFEADW